MKKLSYMTIKEVKKELMLLGYNYRDCINKDGDNIFIVLDSKDNVLVTINKDYTYDVNTGYKGYRELSDFHKKEILNTVMPYIETSVKYREHRDWYIKLDIDIFKNDYYIYKNNLGDYHLTDSVSNIKYNSKFSDKEVAKLRDKYNMSIFVKEEMGYQPGSEKIDAIKVEHKQVNEEEVFVRLNTDILKEDHYLCIDSLGDYRLTITPGIASYKTKFNRKDIKSLKEHIDINKFVLEPTRYGN